VPAAARGAGKEGKAKPAATGVSMMLVTVA
jgi:hypothetical protein